MVVALGRRAPLAAADPLAARIIEHARAPVLPFASSRLLVTAHVFLETLHYGVWLLAIPLLVLRPASPARRRPARRPIPFAPAALAASAALVPLLWIAFARDYVTTRDVYFTLAIVHVIGEAPLLVRAIR